MMKEFGGEVQARGSPSLVDQSTVEVREAIYPGFGHPRNRGKFAEHVAEALTEQHQDIAASGSSSFMQTHEGSSGAFMKKQEKSIVPPNARAFQDMTNAESVVDSDGKTQEHVSIKDYLVKAMDSEDIAVLVDVIQGELTSRGEPDTDFVFAKSAGKTPEDDKVNVVNFIGGTEKVPIVVGIVVATVLLLVCIVAASSGKDSIKGTSRWKTPSLDSSDIESSETGSTDKELKKRMERFENRLEEHTRMLEAEEQAMESKSRGSLDADSLPSSNWMLKR
jgi:hypothetical protein